MADECTDDPACEGLPCETLANAATQLASVTVDGQTYVERPISELIELDKHLKARKASCVSGGNGWGMIAKSRVVPPSAVGEDRV